MFYTKKHNIPGILISIDFQKAFDSVDWAFLDLVLEKFNFGGTFRKWIQILYKNVSSFVINNGNFSRKFSLGRGLRQGDPLSPYLFVLIVEILSNKIRQKEEIEGINVGEDKVKILQYADDTLGCLSNLNSAKTFLQLVADFGKYAGLILNKDKTEGMWIGSLKDNVKAAVTHLFLG